MNIPKTVYSIIKNNLIVTGYFLLDYSRSVHGNKVISLSRKVGGRPVTINLEFIKNGGVWVNPAKYTFVSRTSHFDYNESEKRWSRRKDIILGLVRKLQQAEVWPFITNKNFFQVNENCSSFKKKKGLKNRVKDEMFVTLEPQKTK